MKVRASWLAPQHWRQGARRSGSLRLPPAQLGLRLLRVGLRSCFLLSLATQVARAESAGQIEPGGATRPADEPRAVDSAAEAVEDAPAPSAAPTDAAARESGEATSPPPSSSSEAVEAPAPAGAAPSSEVAPAADGPARPAASAAAAPPSSRGPQAPAPLVQTKPAAPPPVVPVTAPSAASSKRARADTDSDFDRREAMPAAFVARPLTSPRGTFAFSFTAASVFMGSEPSNGSWPSFALGITPQIEVGLSAPLRYDQGIKDWTALEPVPQVTGTFVDRDAWQLGGRLAARIPTRVDTDPLITIGLPALLRPNEYLRLDAELQGELGLEEQTEVSLRLPVSAAVQFTPWFYSRIRGALDLGLTENRTTGLDAGLLAGVTHQTNGQANVDLTLELFVENIGGGRNDRFSDGAGLMFAVGFFPELY